MNVARLESFNVLKKGAPSDLSIYFLKENMIYSLSWSVVGQNMETGRARTFQRSLYLIISVSLLSPALHYIYPAPHLFRFNMSCQKI